MWTTGALTIAAAIGATLIGRDGDGPGSILLWGAAIFFVALTAYGSLVNPRMSADDDGIVLYKLTSKTPVAWTDLTAQVKRTRRFGRDTPALELEYSADKREHLVVLGELELGEHPDDVLADLEKLRARP